jgi:FixJ family two-component response regulator
MVEHAPSFLIAVVDDDPSILKSLGDLLESAEYAVLPFTSAAALIESGALARIDCLISDISMPETDGFELSRLAQSARPGLPVILISGRADMLKRLLPTQLGCYQFFRKPFDGEELLSAVSNAVHSFRA